MTVLKNNQVAYHGAYYTKNFGDQFLLRGFLRHAKSCGVDRISLPFAPQELAAELGASANGLADLSSSEKVVFFGGGYLGQNDNWRSWSERFQRIHLPIIDFVVKEEIPHAILGLGVGPISNGKIREAVVRLFQSSRFASVRDSESYEFLRSNGVTNPNLYQAADAAIALTSDLNPGDPKPARRIIGLHLVYLPPLANLRRFLSILKIVFRAVSIDQDCEIFLFADNPSRFKGQLYLKSLLGALRPFCPVPLRCYWYKDTDDFIIFLNSLSLVITEKLHAGIIATSLGKHTLAVPRHRKTFRYYRQIEKSDQCFEFAEFKNVFTKEYLSCLLLKEPAGLNQKIIDDSTLNFQLQARFLQD